MNEKLLKEIHPPSGSELEQIIFGIARLINTYNIVYQDNIEEPSQDRLNTLRRLRDLQVMYYQDLELEVQKN